MDRHEITAARLAALRAAMKDAGVDALILPQTDPHGSEYIAAHWQARRHFSGFTGSAGPLVVTASDAWVIADSRYWLQAHAQLDGSGIKVIEEGRPGAPGLEELLGGVLATGSVAGIDGQLVSADAFASLRGSLAACGITLVATGDIPGAVWQGRPELPSGEIFVHALEYAGEAAQSKLASLRRMTAEAGARSAFVADLAQVAWLLNVRSTDVAYNPVVISYLYVSPAMAVLFVDEIGRAHV